MADMTDDDAVTGPTASRGAVSVMLLGASDLTGELASAFRHLGADVATVPGYSDTAELTALIDESRPDFVVADTSAVATDALVGLAERDDLEVFPTPRSARLSLDGEGLRRLAACRPRRSGSPDRRRNSPRSRSTRVFRWWSNPSRRSPGRGSRCCCAPTTSSRRGGARSPGVR